jgi:hypothetical protein
MLWVLALDHSSSIPNNWLFHVEKQIYLKIQEEFRTKVQAGPIEQKKMICVHNKLEKELCHL